MPQTEQNAESRIAIAPNFAWDGQKAYLFDIDGTLLRSHDRVHLESFTASVRKVLGHEISLEGIALQGNTDMAILSEACRQSGISATALAERTDAILREMCRIVAARRHELKLRLMPGVKEFLHYLSEKNALLGVASGNLEAIGWIKIEEAGLRPWFSFGGFSDRFLARSELVADAVRQARERMGATEKICVIGDTPRDIEAARANALPIIAVATGQPSFDELLACRPEACVSSLADLLAWTGAAQ
jgi:phosphoglycolate phosphatase-like HAD superfamily hydrolase